MSRASSSDRTARSATRRTLRSWRRTSSSNADLSPPWASPTRLDPIEEGADVTLVLAEQARGQAELGAVRKRERLVQRVDLPEAGDRQEHLLARQKVILREPGDDGRLHEVSVRVRLVLEAPAA